VLGFLIRRVALVFLNILWLQLQDEESRTDEQLQYVCKCSFLEIFNEQITDLLEPTSTNLQVVGNSMNDGLGDLICKTL